MSDLRDITWDDTTTTIDIGGVKLVMTRETGADLALRLAAIYHHENVINAAITGRREVAGRVIERLDRIVDYLKRDYLDQTNHTNPSPSNAAFGAGAVKRSR